jgi:hypothetical protein
MANAQSAPRGHALIVGVTKYDNLPAENWLSGPLNDVVIVRALLRDKLGFDDKDIVTLSESAPSARPTHDNILRELEALKSRVRDGDRVVVYFAGHGARAPHTPRPGDVNPNVVDSLFLPADIGKWDGKIGQVPRAIDNNTFAKRIRELVAAHKGISLCFIADACHSGGIAREKGRGADDEVVRALPADVLGIPPELDQAAEEAQEKLSARSRGAGEPDTAARLSIDLPGVAAMYACRSTERTPERSFPPDPANPVDPNDPRYRYGLFTHTLCSVLSKSSGHVTYNELIQRVRIEYGARPAPIPLAEGSARDSEILGTRVRRSDFRLSIAGDAMTVNAGQVAGFNRGTIFAVFPPPGQAAPDSPPLGHVMVESTDLLEARVKPCAHANVPEPRISNLQTGCICRPVYIDFGIQPLKVYLDPTSDSIMALAPGLRKIALAEGSMFRCVTQRSNADFELSGDTRHPLLLTDLASNKQLTPSGRPSAEESLLNTFQQIARAKNLMQLAQLNGLGTEGSALPQVHIELHRKSGGEYQRIASTNGIELHDKEEVRFRLVNAGKEPVDVTLLFIDSGYGIVPMFPYMHTSADNRIEPGGSRDVQAKVNVDTDGTERVVLIAMAARQAPMDFSFLAQATLEQARGGSRSADAMASPLGQLLRSVQYQDGTTRGMDMPQMNDYVITSLTWQTAKR